MRMRLWTFVATCFYYIGLVPCVRWWKQRAGKSLVILNYHRASGGDLRSHLLYLRRHYRVLHLEDALEELYETSEDKKYRKDRRTLLVLTFDDGYYDNFIYGFPLACELQVPITIFLIPGYIENGNCFWWLAGKHLVHHAQVNEVTIAGRGYHLNQAGEHTLLAQEISMHACNANSVAEREIFLAETAQALEVSSAVIMEEELTRPLKWTEVLEMDASKWISFGAHTMHHPVLGYLTNPSEVQSEVDECRTVLEQQLGHKVCTFAYPMGRLEHIGCKGRHAVQETGYKFAVTTIYGFNTRGNDPYLLRRVEVDVSDHWLLLAAEACGVWGFFAHLRRMPTTLIKKRLRK